MIKIPPATFWHRFVSRGKYPLIFSYELCQGLFGANQVIGFKTKMRNYCRITGGSYVGVADAQTFVAETRQLLQKNPKRIFQWINDYNRHTKDYLEWLKKVNKETTKKRLSKSALKKIYFKYEKGMERLWNWGYLPFIIDEPIEAEITELFIQLGIKPSDIPEVVNILTLAKHLTLHQEEEIALLRLAERVKKQGLKKYQPQIKRHACQWVWKNSWFYNEQIFTEKDLVKEIVNLARKNPKKILKGKLEDRKKKSQKRESFLARFKDRRLNLLADILTATTLWHTIKVEDVTQAVYLVKPAFEQLAKQLGLDYKQFIELAPPEVAKEEINIRILNERTKDSGLVMLLGKITFLQGAKLRWVKGQVEKKPKRSTTLRGFSAFPGKVQGKVLLVSERTNILTTKVTAKDVLVMSMTTTNMNPLIKKAVAIVTDEGGILCHAAIIAREFKKPTVIGTKIATKVLKTGDRVEVDANKGIVKKIR